MRLIRENRVLSAIVIWALIAGTWELTQIGSDGAPPDTAKPLEVLAGSYPDTPRVLGSLGKQRLAEGKLDEALPLLRRAFEAGYKEDESVYASYIDALVRTQSSRETIADVVARWQRDYPASEQLAATRVRLRRARVLP